MAYMALALGVHAGVVPTPSRGPMVQLPQTSGSVVPLCPRSLASLAVGTNLEARRSGILGHSFSITRLSRRPHVFCLRGLLSDAEVKHILSRGQAVGLEPAETAGDTQERKRELREAFDAFGTAGTIDAKALCAVLASLGIEIGDDELDDFYEQLAGACVTDDGVDFETFAAALVVPEMRRKCSVAYLKKDRTIAALNRDITTALLSPEVAAYPDFEDLHVLEYAAGVARASTSKHSLTHLARSLTRLTGVCSHAHSHLRSTLLSLSTLSVIVDPVSCRRRVQSALRRGLAGPARADGASLSGRVWLVMVPARA